MATVAFLVLSFLCVSLCERHASSEEESKDTLAEQEEEVSGKNLFDEFFENQASFTKPMFVDSSISCGTWCSSFGKASSTGTMDFSFGELPTRRKFHETADGKELDAYTFNNGNNLVLQWSGSRVGTAKEWAAQLGGRAKSQLMVLTASIENYHNRAKGAYRISANLGIGNNAKEVFKTLCPTGPDGTMHKYAIPVSWDLRRVWGWTSRPREELLQRYYRGWGKQMELISASEAGPQECADVSDTDVFKRSAECHSRSELEELLSGFEDEETLSKLKDRDRLLHLEEVRQILKRPFKIHDHGWKQINEENVDRVKASLDMSSERSSKEKAMLAKMEQWKHGLLGLKYECRPAIMDFDGTSGGNFVFKKVVLYLSK